jgi:hypothetical protein
MLEIALKYSLMRHSQGRQSLYRNTLASTTPSSASLTPDPAERASSKDKFLVALDQSLTHSHTPAIILRHVQHRRSSLLDKPREQATVFYPHVV